MKKKQTIARQQPKAEQPAEPVVELTTENGTVITLKSLHEFSAEFAAELRALDPAELECDTPIATGRKVAAFNRFINMADALASAESIDVKAAPKRFWNAVAAWKTEPWTSPLNCWNRAVDPTLGALPGDVLEVGKATKSPTTKTPARPVPATPPRTIPTAAPAQAVSMPSATVTFTPKAAPPTPQTAGQRLEAEVAKLMTTGRRLNRSAALAVVQDQHPQLIEYAHNEAHKQAGRRA